jgi:hypothetical protein
MTLILQFKGTETLLRSCRELIGSPSDSLCESDSGGERRVAVAMRSMVVRGVGEEGDGKAGVGVGGGT